MRRKIWAYYRITTIKHVDDDSPTPTGETRSGISLVEIDDVEIDLEFIGIESTSSGYVDNLKNWKKIVIVVAIPLDMSEVFKIRFDVNGLTYYLYP